MTATDRTRSDLTPHTVGSVTNPLAHDATRTQSGSHADAATQRVATT